MRDILTYINDKKPKWLEGLSAGKGGCGKEVL